MTNQEILNSIENAARTAAEKGIAMADIKNHEEDEEIALLEHFEGVAEKRAEEYMKCSKEGLATLCAMKDRSNDLFIHRYKAAREVIDIIARKVGIDPDDSSFWLYAPHENGVTPIADRIESWLSRSGEKVQLKRKVQELEKENAILRSLIQK